MIPLFSGAGFQNVSQTVQISGFPPITLTTGQTSTITVSASISGTPPTGMLIGVPSVTVHYNGINAQLNNSLMLTGPGSFGTPTFTVILPVYAPSAEAATTVTLLISAHLLGGVVNG
jgi:hypothetical protein